jgi:predicted nucleotidyltransferase
MDLLARYFLCVEIYVFGSWSQGIDSARDIDLLLVSDAFDGMMLLKRSALVRSLVGNTEPPIDPLCLTRTQFERLINTHGVFARTIKESLQRIR